MSSQNTGDLSQADASNNYVIPPSQINPDINHDSTNQNKLGSGTDAMGKPVNPMHDSTQTHAPANSPIETPTSAANFPTAQPPHSSSMPTSQPEASQPLSAQADPYVRTSSIPEASGKTPMDGIMQVFNKWSKMAEDMTGNVWGHLRTGPNMADTALGRISMGTRAMTGGGIENLYRQTFEVGPEEHLLKTYACYLSTSTGPVAGTLYISSHKLAFCSDRPLAIPASPPLANSNNSPTTPPGSSAPKASSKTTEKNASSTQQQCYYKVMVPISQVEAVNPSENTEKKPREKYVQVKTQDGHEFWFMGFVNYDKGLKNLQESLQHSKATSPKAASPNTNQESSQHSEATSPNTNGATHVVN